MVNKINVIFSNLESTIQWEETDIKQTNTKVASIYMVNAIKKHMRAKLGL